MGLRKRDAATRNLLGEGVVASYRAGSPNFHVGLEHLYNLGNVRDLVKDEMFHIPSVTKPQAFKVSKDPADGEVKMQVQARSYKDEWGVIDRYMNGCSGLTSAYRFVICGLETLEAINNLALTPFGRYSFSRTTRCISIRHSLFSVRCGSYIFLFSFRCFQTLLRNGEYGPGRMTIMKQWPDLRNTPDHPRKALPPHTLHQHRTCIEAAGPRIKNSCASVGEKGSIVFAGIEHWTGHML